MTKTIYKHAYLDVFRIAIYETAIKKEASISGLCSQAGCSYTKVTRFLQEKTPAPRGGCKSLCDALGVYVKDINYADYLIKSKGQEALIETQNRYLAHKKRLHGVNMKSKAS